MLRVLSTEYSKQKNLIWLTYFKNLAEKSSVSKTSWQLVITDTKEMREFMN